MALTPDPATAQHPPSHTSNGFLDPSKSLDGAVEKEEERKDEDQITPDSSEAQPETRAVTGWKWIMVCAGLYCAIFLYGLDNTIAADIQSAILETYGDVGQLAWIGTGFPLGSVATILPV
jgi:hypothetical protein